MKVVIVVELWTLHLMKLLVSSCLLMCSAVMQCDFRFDLFLVLVLVFQLFFSFSFVPVLSNLLTKTC